MARWLGCFWRTDSAWSPRSQTLAHCVLVSPANCRQPALATSDAVGVAGAYGGLGLETPSTAEDHNHAKIRCALSVVSIESRALCKSVLRRQAWDQAMSRERTTK